MPKRAVNSMAWEVLTMAPRMSGRLRRIPPMCESLKSIPLRGVCENSDSTSSQFSKAMEASLQLLTSLLRKSQEVKRAWLILLMERLRYLALQSFIVRWFNIVSGRLVPTSLQDMNSTLNRELSANEMLERSQCSNVHQWNGRISVCRRWIGYDWKYSWWCFVGILHVFLCPFTEVKVSDSFFRIQPFFQWFGTFTLSL